MRPNLFDDHDGNLLVVVNNEEQHTLWPAFAEVLTSYRMVYGEADRAGHLDHAEQNWTDIRPKILR